MDIIQAAVIKPPETISGFAFDLNGVLVDAAVGRLVEALPGAAKTLHRALARYGSKVGLCTSESWRTVEDSLYVLEAEIPSERIIHGVSKHDWAFLEAMADRMHLMPGNIGYADDSAAAVLNALALQCGLTIYVASQPDAIDRLHAALEHMRQYSPEAYASAINGRLFAVNSISAVEF